MGHLEPTKLRSQRHLPGGPEPPLPLDLLLECAVLVLFWLRLRRDDAAETTGAHTSAIRQMATSAEEKRAIMESLYRVV